MHGKKGSYQILENEIIFKTSRSSGAGGQHVNKVETRVTLQWDINNSKAFTESKTQLLKEKLEAYINADGIFQIHEQSSRSQFKNKEKAKTRFFAIISKALKKKKKRKTTKPTRASKELRIKRKKRNAKIKKLRQKPNW